MLPSLANPMKKSCYCILLVLQASLVSAADLYVATSGSDQNPGTIDRPLATIQRAVDMVTPGETVYIRGGLYRQSIDLGGKAGAPDRPLTITNYRDEKVTFDGTTKIDSEWILDEGKVYKTVLDEDITQLFVDGKLMTLARFPNALAFSDEVWHRTQVRCTQSRESTNGQVVDASKEDKSIAAAGISLNGCVALMNFGAHATTSRRVENHASGSGEFDYSPKLHKYKTTLNYFFEGGEGNAERRMLDRAQEWAYDESTKTLYLWADNGENPNGHNIQGKVQTYAITGDAATKHVVVNGLNFWATAFAFNSSDDVKIRNCNFDYYACSKRALGVLGASETAHFAGTEKDFCKDITIYKCSFKYADATALHVGFAENILVENNLFSRV